MNNNSVLSQVHTDDGRGFIKCCSIMEKKIEVDKKVAI